MTNYEKNKELLDMYAVSDVSWGVKKNGKVFDCDPCSVDCIFCQGTAKCSYGRLKWLQKEYKESEPEVDWSKVPIDTPILVKQEESHEWSERYFAGYIFGKVCAFDYGRTSENFDCILSWKHAKLAEQEM